MSFLKRQFNIIKKRALSLQGYFKEKTYTNTFPPVFPKTGTNNLQLKCNSFSKRAFPDRFFFIHNGGSMTLEAALSLPIFLFAVISVLSFMEVLRAQMEINSALGQTAKELSIYGHAAGDILGNEQNLSLPAGVAFSETYVRNRVYSQLSEELQESSLIQNLAFADSKIMDNDRIELTCFYTVKPYFALSFGAGFVTESKAVARAFTGYDNLQAGNPAVKEEYVYITESGHAYHKSRSCHYLDLSIREVGGGNTEALRNQSGGKYYACPLCAKSGTGGVIYITDYGDRYHYDLLCSGLKRTVKAVLLSEVGGRTPCSKCYH